MHYLPSNTNLGLSFLLKLKFYWLQNKDPAGFHTETDTLTSPSWWKGVKIFLQGWGITVQLRDADHHHRHHHSRRIHITKQVCWAMWCNIYGKMWENITAALKSV